MKNNKKFEKVFGVKKLVKKEKLTKEDYAILRGYDNPDLLSNFALMLSLLQKSEV